MVTGPFDFYKQYIGLSSDTKPVDARGLDRFYETDTGSTYIYTGTQWVLEA